MTNFRLFIWLVWGDLHRPTYYLIFHTFFTFLSIKKLRFSLHPITISISLCQVGHTGYSTKCTSRPSSTRKMSNSNSAPKASCTASTASRISGAIFDASSNGDNSVVTSNSMSNLRFILIETCYPIKRHHNIVCSSWFISPALYSPATVGGWQKRSVSVS